MGMGWMGLGWLLLAATIAFVVWAAARASRGAGGESGSPREVLKRRYAKGEIDRETYQRMLRDLGGE
jgi:putative membrane protein